jgi:hypothetical protein
MALLVAGAVALVVRLWPRRRPRRAAAPDPEAVAAGYDAVRAAALRLADEDPRAALRMLYAGALGELGRRRGWRPRLFEGAVYGDEPVAPDDVRRADALTEAMLA